MDKKIKEFFFEYGNTSSKSRINKTFALSQKQNEYINNVSEFLNRDKQFVLFCLIELGSEKLDKYIKNN